MKMKLHYYLAVGALLGLAALPAFPVSEGEIAPYICLKDQKGHSFESYTFKNKTNIVVSFFLIPCPPCFKEIPHLQKLQNKYNHITTVLVCDKKSTKAQAAELLQAIEKESGIPINLKVVFDRFGVAQIDYNVTANPTTFLIDTEGKVILRIEGYNETKSKLLESTIESLNEKSK